MSQRPTKACSPLCAGKLINTPESNAKRKETSLRKWGTEFPQQSPEVKSKIKEANLAKYGATSPLGSPELREKGKKTSLEKYGSEWYATSEEGKARRARTNKRLYGHENPFGSKELQDKIRATNLERYGSIYHMQNPDVVDRVKATNIARYGVPNVLMVPWIKEKAMETFHKNANDGMTHSRISGLNRKLAELLKSELGQSVALEAPLDNFFVDFIVDDRLFVDLHPTISHNSLQSFGCVINSCEDGCPKHAPTARDYHFKRAKAALDKDVTLIQWYGWESHDKLISYLKRRFEPARKFSARKLELVRPTQKQANDFLQEHHSQGRGRGQQLFYGLAEKGELLAVATFGKARFGNKAEWEFNRYAVKSAVVIHGGSGRLFEAFRKESSPKSVVSYIDFNHTTRQHTFLHGLGFQEIAPTGPALMWHRVADNRAVNQTSLLARGADRLLGTSYGSREESGLDNRGIMLVEGFLPVYTAGNRVTLWSA